MIMILIKILLCKNDGKYEDGLIENELESTRIN